MRAHFLTIAISLIGWTALSGCGLGSPMYTTLYQPVVESEFRGVTVTCWPTYREVRADLTMRITNRRPDTLVVDLLAFRAESVSTVDRDPTFQPYNTSASRRHCLEYRGDDDEVGLCRVMSRSFAGMNERFDLGMDADTSSGTAPADSIEAVRFFPVTPRATERVGHSMGFRYGEAVPYGTRAPDILDRDECMERFKIREDTLLVTTPPVLKGSTVVIPSRQIRFIYQEDE